MDNKKVTLPRDVAEAIESLRSEWNDWGVVMLVKEATDIRAVIVYNHFTHDLTKLLSALVNGYNIEQTPEEKVREYYFGLKETQLNPFIDAETRECAGYEASGVKQALKILGIRIEGVDA